MRKIVIAIDGYSGCGKSTTAKSVAAHLGYVYIDSGAMYRAVTLYFHDNYVNLENPLAVNKALENIQIKFQINPTNKCNEVYLNGLNVEKEIRKLYVSDKVSEVSAIPEVRHHMTAIQKKLGKKRGVVMDGRDIGTTVFPDAELKIFMEADIYIRAQRRQKEMFEKDQVAGLEEIIENLKKRDFLDTTRKESPLVKANDAFLIDTTFITIDEQVDKILDLATGKIFIGEEEKVERAE
ncbi:MAG TPA: (d)CMP kinase [Cytophagales bacterium]|nr:(d)CMP kinase [Cytophagales bacterium]